MLLCSKLLAIAVLWGLLCLPALQQRETNARETILDRRITISNEIRPVPYVDRRDTKDIFHSEELRINGTTLWVESAGHGMPLVLIHGGPGATHFGFHFAFNRAHEFARVIYYDQRGCGLSGYESGSGYSIQQAVDDLEALRQKLRIERWTVLGHSYGGLLAQIYAVQHPEHLQALVLVGSSLPAFVILPSRVNKYLSPRELRRIGELTGGGVVAGDRNPRAIDLTTTVFNTMTNGAWKREYFKRPTESRMAEIALYEVQHDDGFKEMMYLQQRRWDLSGAFRHFPVPTLIIEGRYDLLFAADKPRIIQSFHPGSHLEVLDRAGHFSFDDAPAPFFETLRSFLNNSHAVSDHELRAWRRYYSDWEHQQDELLAREAEFLRRLSASPADAESTYMEYKKHYRRTRFVRDVSLDLLATDFLKQGKTAEALAILLVEIKEYPRAFDAFQMLGEVYTKTGKTDLAIRSYRRSLAIRPDNGECRAALQRLEADSHFAAP
jgi:proline iminopeptidase